MEAEKLRIGLETARAEYAEATARFRNTNNALISITSITITIAVTAVSVLITYADKYNLAWSIIIITTIFLYIALAAAMLVFTVVMLFAYPKLDEEAIIKEETYKSTPMERLIGSLILAYCDNVKIIDHMCRKKMKMLLSIAVFILVIIGETMFIPLVLI